jgi:CheY-like chemotaxis protein
MLQMTILLVEDNKTNIKDFEEFAKEFSDENPTVSFQHIICENEEKAYEELKLHNFNAAIIDLDLHKDKDAGIRIVDKIHDNYRIPMIVFSGNANRTDDKNFVLKSITKGHSTYGDLIQELYSFNKTGIMNILGRTGQLEKLIDQVFWNNLHPKMPQLQKYAQEHDIEKDLLRYIVSHFSEVLEDGVRHFFPEEMFIYPPISLEIKTGAILKSNSSNEYFIVMSPPCDIQQGCDRFVLASISEISSLEEVKKKYKQIDDALLELSKYHKITPDDKINKGTTKELENNIKGAKNNVLSKINAFIDKPSNRYHYLSSNDIFGDSIIDFHEIITIPRTMVASSFSKKMSITPPFLKDIQSRFSSYYARQGSPDFDTSKIIDKYKAELFS